MQDITPVIIPVVVNPPPRDCILQDGHRYCEDTPATGHDVGVILLGVVAFLAWIGGVLWWADRNDSQFLWRCVIGFLGPLLLVGTFLVLR